MDASLQPKSIEDVVEAWLGYGARRHEIEGGRLRAALTDLSSKFDDKQFVDASRVAAEKNDWVLEYFRQAIAERPDLAWQAILQIWSTVRDDPARAAALAAGPVEDLLEAHGSEALKWIEHQLVVDPRIRDLLDGLWQGRMTAETWNRVQAIRGCDG
jgi:hypothetical protein